MKELLKKIFNRDIFVIILIGAFLFGLIKYIDYRLSLIESNIKVVSKDNLLLKNILENKIKNIEEVVLGTKDNLTNVIEKEKEKSVFLENQFNEITNTVGVLEKLSSTDPELLKKYSKVYFLNEHYVPVSLSEIGPNYRTEKSTNFEIHSDVLSKLENLIDDSKKEDLNILVLSAYRSFAKQADLKATYKITYGAGANRFSADQGYSEHQLGTTVDFTTVKLNNSLNGFEKTLEYKWLLDNAHKYGFILSYGEGNKYYRFEPWHWRYVGVALATRLHGDGMNFYDLDQRIIDSYLTKIFE